MSSAVSIDRKSERGVVAILMAVGIVLVLGFAAFAIDIGSALVTKAELQNVSDASTLAANRELALVYRELGVTTNYKTYQLTSADESRIMAKASAYAAANKAGGSAISVLPSDVVFGTYDKSTGEISPTTTGVRAISIVARRDESANGVLQTTLGRVLGINQLSVKAQSAAGISALGTLKAGKGEVPVGISSYWFEQNACGPESNIKFYPTNTLEGCAGWHTFEEFPANAARLNSILEGLETEAYQSPETTAGVTEYNFIGGTVAARYADIKALYDLKKDPSGDWTVTIPVYEAADCRNPSGPIVIIGFARATIYHIGTPPDMSIDAHVECGIFDDLGEGNGPNDYGTLVGIPGMIQ